MAYYYEKKVSLTSKVRRGGCDTVERGHAAPRNHRNESEGGKRGYERPRVPRYSKMENENKMEYQKEVRLKDFARGEEECPDRETTRRGEGR